MSLRDTPDAVLARELHEEMASALGRAGTRLERAITALENADDTTHAVAVTEARDALWCLIVQREACGLGDGGADLLRLYRVPPAIAAGVVVERPTFRRRGFSRP